MTDGFTTSPPQPTTGGLPRTPDTSRYTQQVTDTVQRIMGEDIAPVTGASGTPSGVSGNNSTGDSSTADVAKEQAGQVADTAKQAGGQVVDTVKDQAGQVTTEAKQQAKQLLSQAQSELSEQAASTQQRVSEGLHALADELSGMAENSEQDGVATDLARQAADRARSAAGWLGDRDPGSLLTEVRSFARQRPGAFLALALGAGVVAGRLTRGLTAPADSTPSGGPSHAADLGSIGSATTGSPTRTSAVTGFETGSPEPVLPTAPAALGGLGTNGTPVDPRTAP